MTLALLIIATTLLLAWALYGVRAVRAGLGDLHDTGPPPSPSPRPTAPNPGGLHE